MKKLFIIFAILCLAAPAMAADWNFYGSARFATFWNDVDPDKDGVDSDEDLTWAQQGNSRIGATVKFNDQIGGGFEMSDSFGKRKLYGTYTFGNGSQLLIGQTYTPSALFYSNSVYDGDGDLLGAGEFYEGRLPMIQWKMGNFKLALIEPNTSGEAGKYAKKAMADFLDDDAIDPDLAAALDIIDIDYDALADELGIDVDTSLPKIEVGYAFKSDAFFADVFAGYQTYEIELDDESVDVDSYVIGGGAGANFGAFFVKAGVHFGQNLGNYGAYDPKFNGKALADDMSIDDDLKELDSDSLGYLAVVGFNASEMLTFEAGYGYEEAEVDESDNTTERTQYYLNCTVNVAPGFFIVPEVGMITYEDEVTEPEPETFYVGAKWQINF
ncbi:hypothetical protein DSCA_30140 [Desulfosarcina alkanivorans]|uniref:Porin n=1 Tax=Desulfosarcina alkanivorans TaxID=571177 RepID=A0A5K7YS28_9BACT|nr:hypothetical protein [Desulfosarcina alkanivorans]BBO69084.1 hypothetical protein DSCA_30140 [Desulfosarcina alkanivorans]